MGTKAAVKAPTQITRNISKEKRVAITGIRKDYSYSLNTFL